MKDHIPNNLPFIASEERMKAVIKYGKRYEYSEEELGKCVIYVHNGIMYITELDIKEN